MLLKRCRPPAHFDFLKNIELESGVVLGSGVNQFRSLPHPFCSTPKAVQGRYTGQADSELSDCRASDSRAVAVQAEQGNGMLEQISKQEVLERVMHIYALYRDTADPSTRNSPEHSIRLKVLRDAIDNLHHPRSRLAPRMLARLSHHAGLTIGGAFMLVGYPLDKMREVEFLLNGQRTRIV